MKPWIGKTTTNPIYSVHYELRDWWLWKIVDSYDNHRSHEQGGDIRPILAIAFVWVFTMTLVVLWR